MPHLIAFLCLLFGTAASASSPVFYGVSVNTISEGTGVPGLRAVRARLPEIQALGANVLWLMPVTPAFEEDGHGYDVVDYKSVWPRLGTAGDLRGLVADAHRRGMRVILDVVLNHSSDAHPFVKDIAARGAASPYFRFYQHGPKAGVPYAQHFHTTTLGSGRFVYYFWEHLVNFDYDQPALRAYVLDVLKFWMREFGVDGFRFDASWGPSSRWPAFYSTVSRELRLLNPRVILLAEDKAGYPAAYRGTGHPHLRGSGFNVAYDWDPMDPHWMSKWSFQLEGEDESRTVFNLPDAAAAAQAFVRAVRAGEPVAGIRTLRYLENNDTPGFLRHHTLAQEVFAAKAMWMLPGVPLVFYGQETGTRHEKFALPVFPPSRPLSSYEPKLWSFYQALIALRKGSDLLGDGRLENLGLAAPGVASFERVIGPRRVRVEIDFGRGEVRLGGKRI